MSDLNKVNPFPVEGIAARSTASDSTNNSSGQRAEEALRASEQRLLKQNQIIGKLMKRCFLESSEMITGLSEITEAAAHTLEIERTSAWFYNDDHSIIRCADLYERSANRHTEGPKLTARNYPSYFQALEQERTIVAHDALTDSRTKEFRSSYLSPLGITSMLDAPIRLGQRVIGVICHEHVGPPRLWTLDEQLFAGTMADLVSLVMQEWERQKGQKDLESSNSLLRATLESTADGILVADNNGRMVSFNRKFVEMWKLPESIITAKDDNKARAFAMNQLIDPESFIKRVMDLYGQPDAESFDSLELKDGRIIERYSQPQRLGRKNVGRVWSFRDVSKRMQAEEALRKTHSDLEKRIELRTAELSKANVILKYQIAERRRAEEALQDALLQLQQLSHHTLQIQENAYQIISRELHDNVAQSVNAIKMRLEKLVLDRNRPLPKELQLEIRTNISHLKTISQDIRTLSKQMRPEILDEMGLFVTLESYTKDFQTITGIKTEFMNETTEKSLPPNLETHLYRIVQEALNNTARHAHANRVNIRLEQQDNVLILSIQDNGTGFKRDGFRRLKKPAQGIGLISMQERANLLNGTLEIISEPERGTAILVKVPISK